MKPPGQLTEFRAFPERGTLFYKVRVFGTLKAFNSYIRRGTVAGRTAGHGCRGMCSSYDRINITPGRRNIILPEIGEILLVQGWLGAGVVTHECQHAVFGYFRRRKIKFPCRMDTDGHGDVSPVEERACYALSNLVSRIYRVLEEKGINNEKARKTDRRKRAN